MIKLLTDNSLAITYGYCILAGLLLFTTDASALLRLFALVGILIGAAGFVNIRSQD